MALAIRLMLFCMTNLPELIHVILALVAFFREHQDHPSLSSWLTGLFEALSQSKAAKSLTPVVEFLQKIDTETAKHE